jgi:acyl-CoA synthetase (AMP-forming)/AMP-acid ligase II
MLGYLGVLETTQPALQTGDLGSIANGELRLDGRIGRSINRGGVMISPERIEEVLRQFPGVRDCSVLGVPHVFYGEAPAATVTGDSVTIEELMRWCAANLASEEVPVWITVCETLEQEAKAKELSHHFQSEHNS